MATFNITTALRYARLRVFPNKVEARLEYLCKHESHCLQSRGLLYMRIAYNFTPVDRASSSEELHKENLHLE